MRRGKTQVLFKFLPECVVDYNMGKCIAIVSQWDGKELRDVNKYRIINRIHRNFVKFKSTTGFSRQKNVEEYEILTPKNVDVDLYPLTFICRKCGHAQEFKTPQQFSTLTRSSCTCLKCQGSLMQMDLVYVHTCGHFKGLNIAPCKSHGFREIVLDRQGKSPKDWRWVCQECKVVTSSLNNWCPSCSGQVLYPKPFKQSIVFMPQSETFINIVNMDERKLYENEDYRKLVIAEYLGILKEKGKSIQELSNITENSPEMEQASRFLSHMKKSGMSDDMINMAMKSFREANPDPLEIKKNILDEVERCISNSGEEITDKSISISEFLETLNLRNTKHLKKIIEVAESRGHPSLITVRTFPKKMETIGVKNAYVLSNLPITKTVYGYTRGDLDSKKCTLKAFKPDNSAKDKIPIYVNQSETEGILLEFDRLKILKWLKINGIISELPKRTDDKSLKEWFINNVNVKSVERFQEISPDDIITKSVYQLIHSISHALLIKASAQSGIDRDSLGELIFPCIPAIIIYSGNSQGFQLGGMFTLFESKIYPWIDMTIQKLEDGCIYDPVCMSGESSCHACLYTSEFSCEHSNRDLGRASLIGKKFDNGTTIVGFWDPKFRNSVSK